MLQILIHKLIKLQIGVLEYVYKCKCVEQHTGHASINLYGCMFAKLCFCLPPPSRPVYGLNVSCFVEQ